MADKKIHLSYEDYLNLAIDIPGRPKCLTNYVIYNWIDGGYYNLNTYSYYIYLPAEFVATGTYQVQIIKLIRYQTGAGLQQAKAYVDNAIAAIVIPDVSNFITMAAVEAKGYQTESQVNTLINTALGAISNAEDGAY